MSAYSVVPVSEARQSLAPLIARVRQQRAPVYLSRRGRRIAAIIGADELDELIRRAERVPDARPGDDPQAAAG